jgi:phage major head subunit gpT-like protein
MAQVNVTTTPEELLPGIRTEFMKNYTTAPQDWQQVATTVDSTLRTETYAWLGQSPQVRQFIGERIPRGLSEFHFTITNLKWENTLSVDREDVEDEKYGQIIIRAGQLGEQAAKHRNILAWQTLAAGFSNVCYDGSDYFATTHQENLSGTQSNYSTAPLTATNYAAARAAMMQYQDDTGIILGIMPRLLIVPAAKEYVARLLLDADIVVNDTIAAPQANVWKGSSDLLMVPWLTNQFQWFLVDTNQYIKPLIFQLKEEMTLKVLDGSSDSERAFMRDEWLYGTRARYNFGYGDWRVAFGSNASS